MRRSNIPAGSSVRLFSLTSLFRGEVGANDTCRARAMYDKATSIIKLQVHPIIRVRSFQITAHTWIAKSAACPTTNLMTTSAGHPSLRLSLNVKTGRLFGAATIHFSDRILTEYPARRENQTSHQRVPSGRSHADDCWQVEKAKHTQEGKGRNGVAHIVQQCTLVLKSTWLACIRGSSARYGNKQLLPVFT